jgi:hypothetical protein
MGGGLRFSRRGETVYFLLAEGDSSNFRLVRTEKVASDDLQVDGVRLVAQMKELGRMQVTWKHLSIRAEALAGLALEDHAQIVASVDRQRETLPSRYSHDFSRDPPSIARLHHWGFAKPPVATPNGVRVFAPPVDVWSSSGFSPHILLRGDFDISFEFAMVRVDVPKPGQYSAAYLQLEFPGESALQSNVIFAVRENGQPHVSAQLRLTDAKGVKSYPSLRQEFAAGVQRLRFARQGSELFFLYSNKPSEPDRLLARYDVSNVDLPDGAVRLLLHSGGAAKVTEAMFKRFTVHAQGVENIPANGASPSAPVR